MRAGRSKRSEVLARRRKGGDRPSSLALVSRLAMKSTCTPSWIADVFTSDRLDEGRRAIDEQTKSDRRLLDDLLADVRSIRSEVRTIKRRTTTSISLVASDGGNNKLAFDPFLMQVVRIVD